MSSVDTAVRLLLAERPDLVPLLRRLTDRAPLGYIDDVDPADMRELARRGLIDLDQ